MADTPSPTRDRELHASLRIAATREQVFAAFLDPVRLARWWGPAGFRNTFAECDPRPGGRWRYVMHGPDGRNFPNESLFAEVDPPGRVVIRHVSAPHFDLVVTLSADGDGTQVDWVQRFETAEVREKVGRIIGPSNQENLERLEAEVLAVQR